MTAMTTVTAPRAEGITVVFAGGGSGGHLSPGLAVAEALRESDAECRLLFLCSEREIDRAVLSGAGVEFAPVPAAPFSLRPGAFLRFLRSLPRATKRSRALLTDANASIVLALGGFVSVPVVRAARRLRIPVVLLNLDAVAGRANRLLARSCRRILAASPATGLPPSRMEIVGMPIRRAAQAPAPAEACRARLGLDPHRPTLLVTGASQGSRSLNESLPAMIARHREHFRRWQVLHLCGAMDRERVEALRAIYREADIPALVVEFMHEIGIAWGAATLAVTRAGASSVAEAEFNGVPAIFVPFPHHRDQHQRRNAAMLVTVGGALLARDPLLEHGDDPPLESTIVTIVTDESRLTAMTERMHARKARNPAREIATVLRTEARAASRHFKAR